MAVSIPMDTGLGIDLSAKYATGVTLPSPLVLGFTVRAANGRLYQLATTTTSIANDTAVVLTGDTVAAGAGAFTTRSGAIVSGDRVFVESNAS